VAWVVVLLALAVAGLRYWMPVSQPASDPLSLALVDHDGQVMIQWNPASKSVKNAARGSLQIMDGTETRTVALKPMDLAGGRSTYVRRSGDVEVRLTVEDSAGARVQEASRFLGRPPELEAEVARLRQANQDQALRIQTLERTLRILQTRLGIVDQGKQ
jgi:hypothetical protein